MFLDRELKNISLAMDNLALCHDLRRRLVLIELQSIRCRAGRTLSNLNLGWAVAEQILDFLRGRKARLR